MSEKINVAEILKDCPKGTELYSPLCGKCVFDRLNFGTIICKKQNTQEITFTSKGYYMFPVFDDCECMIFPSKDQRDWSKFEPPYKFKDGDILFVKSAYDWLLIYKESENDVDLYKYVATSHNYSYSFITYECIPICSKKEVSEIRLATEEEKKKLFDAIKANGYKWNAETKALEKLVEPKFKVGDKIKYKNGKNIDSVEQGVILSITDEVYDVAVTNNMGVYVSIAEQDDWELVPNKFDITTLKPFDRVLMRPSNAREWVATFYSHYSNDYFFGCGMMCQQCIPYERNEHLLGKTDDCDEYFKNW